jgi:hypothetical protein
MHVSTVGAIRLTARLLLTDRHGVAQDDLTPYVVRATVDLDVDRAVSPLLLRGELRRAGLVTAYTAHLQPWLRLEYPDGEVIDEPVGLYAVAPPGRRRTYSTTREELTGHDHTWRLAQSYFTEPYSVAAGSNVVAAVKAILAGEGFTDLEIAITSSSKTLTETATWGLDQTVAKITVIRHLLDAIAYTPLHSTRQGQLRAIPLPDLATAPIAKTYSLAGGQVTAEVAEDPDADRVCNVVRVMNDRDGAAPILAVAENHNPASPVSIENLDGRRIFREFRDDHIPDQATAETIALRELERGATYDNRVRITTGLDPTRNPHEVYGFALTQRGGESVLAGRWRCAGWSLGFMTKDAAMTHQIGKVVPVS